PPPPATQVFLTLSGSSMAVGGQTSSGGMSSMIDGVAEPWARLSYKLPTSLHQHQSHRSRIRLVPAEVPDPLDDQVCSKEIARVF
ncbi:hypothetical protein, partial [Limnohabitans sp.]|uniref:hypothetical protein n=1 Tax=Limnohabitans sp. TaxID=1907725 RepID=UPI002B0037CE